MRRIGNKKIISMTVTNAHSHDKQQIGKIVKK